MNEYTTGGYPEQLTYASDGSVYARIVAMDAWGHAIRVYEGGSTASIAAVILARSYDPATGLERSTVAGHGTAPRLGASGYHLGRVRQPHVA